MADVTKQIADFVVGSSYEEMPHDSVVAARECILDGLSCALAGSVEPVSKIINEYVREQGGNPQATVIAGGFKTSIALAALANGVMIHALDYDDNCFRLPLHPSAVILPAILALGEMRHASGKEVLEGYLLGFEIAAKLGRIIQEHYYNTGWHNTGTVGTVGAAVAAAKIMKLTRKQVQVALGIAASEAAGLRKNFGTMTKPFHAGKAAENGVVAALLAKKGFSANESIFEGPLGFCATLGGSEEALNDMYKSMGSPYELESPGVTLKAYPSCFGTHKGIEGILSLKSEYGFKSDDIVEIEVETDPVLPQVLAYHQPRTPLEAKFSLEYCVTIAALDGRVGLQQFSERRLLDPHLQELLQRVKYVHVNGVQKRQAEYAEKVTIRLRNGSTYNRRISVVKGEPRNPMRKEERMAKYHKCASLILGNGDTENLLALALDLETIDDITKLTDIILCATNDKKEKHE